MAVGSFAKLQSETSTSIPEMLAKARREGRAARIRLTVIPVATAMILATLPYILTGVPFIGVLVLPGFLVINLSMLPGDKRAIKSIVIITMTLFLSAGCYLFADAAYSINEVFITIFAKEECYANAIPLLDDEESVGCGFLLLHELRCILSGASYILCSLLLGCGMRSIENSGALLKFYMRCTSPLSPF